VFRRFVGQRALRQRKERGALSAQGRELIERVPVGSGSLKVRFAPIPTDPVDLAEDLAKLASFCHEI
jgi:hypothetical protein